MEEMRDCQCPTSPIGRTTMTPIVTLQQLEVVGKLQPDESGFGIKLFVYKEILQEKKTKIIRVKLKKPASIWWENLKRKCGCEGKSKIKT